MEAHDAGDVFAQIIAALAAGLAGAVGERAIGDDAVADLVRGHVRADGCDFAGRLDADDQRQLALGERHAAPAPDVDVVEPDRLDADLHFAGARRRRRGDLDQFDLAVGNERERAHGPRRCSAGAFSQRRCRGAGHAGSRASTSDTFWPPKPNELEMTCVTLASRATFGTTSSGMPGSGTLWLMVGGMR